MRRRKDQKPVRIKSDEVELIQEKYPNPSPNLGRDLPSGTPREERYDVGGAFLNYIRWESIHFSFPHHHIVAEALMYCNKDLSWVTAVNFANAIERLSLADLPRLSWLRVRQALEYEEESSEPFLEGDSEEIHTFIIRPR